MGGMLRQRDMWDVGCRRSAKLHLFPTDTTIRIGSGMQAANTPSNLSCHVPISTYFRLNNKQTQFKIVHVSKAFNNIRDMAPTYF